MVVADMVADLKLTPLACLLSFARPKKEEEKVADMELDAVKM